MCIIVERILNKPVDSNSFVIYTKANNSCIVIDPGTEDCDTLIEFIKRMSLHPEYIFLTHEHFDHIWGVNKIKDTYNCKIVCSKDCSDRIIDSKKNMSLFYNQIGFVTYPADISIKDTNFHLEWNEIKIEFISTKGHSDASICILIDNNLFTGDTIIKNSKTVVKLPGGSKSKLIESISILNNKFLGKRILIQSGHGESFWYGEIKNHMIL
jgi:glyoxylase-like metal-dependent hydrolase (beta-lactamase superfamily II)